MRVENKGVTILYRGAFLLLCGYGLYLNSGLPQGKLNLTNLWFYTILSNLMCFIYFAACVIKTAKNWHSRDSYATTVIPRFKGGVTLGITVTFLVYQFLLVPNAFEMNPNYSIFSLANVLVHYVVPILTILDWLLFDVKGNYRWMDPFLWLLPALSYFAVVSLRGWMSQTTLIGKSYYPYYFIDFDVLGAANVFLNVLVLVVFFLILGYLIFGVDRLLKKKKTSGIRFY